ncbi:remorin 4.1 [Prunus yedoensis var. nudiflora]|uniref:Remorin 4.1 n=1 Tax=Prunus yedoensis var. nudiflora TaxID=2094558 RepID=A0A314XME1_PRUYE|nr:remorin 4.1 [Prunus yedoensis var. nudiflora]
MNDQRAGTSQGIQDLDDHGEDEQIIRDIHALTPPDAPLLLANRGRRREAWETSSHRSSSLSMASSEGAPSENFSSISREFSALVVAGSAIGTNNSTNENDSAINHGNNNLGRIGEEDNMPEEEHNPLAIVPDNYNPSEPIASPRQAGARNNAVGSSSSIAGLRVIKERVKKEEVESKISAWQNNKIAKLNNRFKREDAIINGWESEQVQKASSWMKKVERKLEEKRARALEKMQNDIAKAHRKSEERRASAEAKRGTKVARVLEIANLMRAVGRAPAKKSFF